MRSVKSPDEIKNIRQVQRSTERAMNAALSLLRKSKPVGETLMYRDRPLTSEGVKATIQKELIGHGCIARDTIVSCGPETAIPHRAGKGPLRPDEPIVIDIYPQNEESGYFADMTRTVVKGEPSQEIADMFRAVCGAQAHAISCIRAGISGPDLQQEIVDLFKEQGYESNAEGFIHNLGHGIGLEVHEAPILGIGGGNLRAGNVITIEPGLYYPAYGGIRLEDMGVVTENGFDRFTQFEEILIL
jgi:Xaa-Pro aminopeptidase